VSCICQQCGKKYKVDLVVPNNLWEQIKPEGKPRGADLMCGFSITERIEEISNYDYWHLVKQDSLC